MQWEDDVDQDMRILEVKNWKKVALDRDQWAKLLKKARAHQGCRANDDDDEEVLKNCHNKIRQCKEFSKDWKMAVLCLVHGAKCKIGEI